MNEAAVRPRRSPDNVVGELDEAARLELAGRLKVFTVAAEPTYYTPLLHQLLTHNSDVQFSAAALSLRAASMHGHAPMRMNTAKSASIAIKPR